MTRALTWTAITATTVLALAACTGADEPPPPPSSGGTTAPSSDSTQTSAPTDEAATTSAGPALNTFVPVAAGTERAWPEVIDTVSKGEAEFALFGVYRIDAERVVVSGRYAGQPKSNTAAAEWFEPGYFHSMGGYEFSRVAVTGADGVRHLPVRDEEDRCLCSLSTQPYADAQDPQAPAWVVVSAPADAKTLDVEVSDIGTIKDVPVTDLPTAASVPFGWVEVLSVDALAREDGVITAGTTIANVSDLNPTYTLAQHQFDFPDLEGQDCFQGLSAWGSATPTGRMAQDPDCHRGTMPGGGQQISLEVKVADPGSQQVVILPDAGLPLMLPVTGTPTEGQAASLRSYAARTEEAGATVEQGEELTVSLDTEVLFDFDKATLTGAADDALAVAAKTLKAQDKRAITIAGHTDGQGSAARNLELSEQRAKAVAKALGDKLGADWQIAVEWHGMSKPAVKESGSPAQVKAAQARNRRVEIVVP
ncbi:MAG: OmpA family protein [Ornithinimicrobium sp.]|uniref:OmpA family protein n=1 Tax=Ornithinimicrobium sp. TaxID=1977084 RepID=UPI0026DF792B|nr:OmpA family protein [Ornithinimicrobium sp.]MDO5740452.1 OmpA family protein [Ornithinimicrobium sp.]